MILAIRYVGTTTAAEDEPDLRKVNFDLEMFEYLVRLPGGGE
jgi:hypothetical protein